MAVKKNVYMQIAQESHMFQCIASRGLRAGHRCSEHEAMEPGVEAGEAVKAAL